MKRICIGLLTALGCIAVATALIVRPFSKKSIQSYVLRNQDELTNYARKVIEEHPMGPLEWNGWKVYYYADDMVEFCTGSFGLIPSTTYKGFYYSEDDEPHGFQDVPVEFVKSGNGWSWAESEGDNTQYTERIAAHWYWYEAKFATVYKGNIIKNLIMDCQSYTKYRPNETMGGIFVSWRRKEELPTGLD